MNCRKYHMCCCVILLAFLKVSRTKTNGADLCLMHSSAQRWCLWLLGLNSDLDGPMANLQRRLAHPKIHYRSVSNTHLGEALQQQITSNNLVLLSSPLCLLGTNISLPLPITVSAASCSAHFLSITALMIPHFSSHSS